jgi:hypothetical protein
MPAELQDGEELYWEPNSEPQAAFCAAEEDELFYGGAKGGAKSDALLFKSLRQVNLSRYKALILRQTFGEVQELIDRSHRVFPHLANGPEWSGTLKRWVFPNPRTQTGAGGAIVQFGHCKRKEEVQQFHGQEWAYIAFDEIADVADEQIWVRLQAENRCPNPEVKRQLAGSGNPGKAGHPWVKRRFIDKCGIAGDKIYHEDINVPGLGTVTRSRRFIPAKVTDNPVYASDPIYMANLLSLPEVLKRQLLYGDWEAGFGMGLEELTEGIHIVTPFDVPEHWRMFGAFDWGFQHPWVFGLYAINEDGVIYKIDTIRGRWMSDRRIAERIKHWVDIDRLSYVTAGHDCWAEWKARRDDTTPSTADRFSEVGIHLTRAATGRHAGLKNFREQVAWKEIMPGEPGEQEDGEPNFFWMDTPGNRKAFESIATMVVDEDDPEDVLKQNADPVTGEGGDDDYDETRYALASRPARTMPTWTEQDVRAWSPAVLHYEREQHRRHSSIVVRRTRIGHQDMGGY